MNKNLLHFYIILLGSFSLGFSFLNFVGDSIEWELLMPFIIMTCIAEKFKVRISIYNTRESVSISWTSVLCIGVLVIFGIREAIIVSALAGLTVSLYQKLPAIKTFYNVFSYVTTVILTSILANYLLVHTALEESSIMYPFTLSFAYILHNYILTVLLMLIVTGKRIKTVVEDVIGPHIAHSLIFAVIGGLLGQWYKQYGVISIVLSMFLIFLVSYGLKASALIFKKRLVELERSNKEKQNLVSQLDQTLEDFIATLTATIDARDPFMYGHSLQVSNYALAIATELKLKKTEIEQIRIAGLLHDIGKISIPEHILFKDGKLSDDEYEIIKQHAEIGEEILNKIHSLRDVATLVGMHHERYDGKGYPRGLKNSEVPIGAHILAVADTLDTILSDRAYKRGMRVEDALNEIQRCKGTQFHPAVVEALMNIRKTLGDHIFKNSAKLVQQSVVDKQIKSNSRIIKLMVEKQII
ncbi:HD-GYP domain-containing protein [Salirhabdus salicampi]|uniref:HD-GYP domain-containing protein n=1 Tax=Salirhabdus salicampi TaxID=476102 RepID=UPI0020C38D28|nr:HD-GYP domain-containing protein [Salirhabdus salicampi]MCP8617331.1 HD-GYP domain-containing protein [Salirhabdus salicampi]